MRIDWGTRVVAVGLIIACAGRARSEAETGDESHAKALDSVVEQLDAELARGWAAAGIEPSPTTSDAEFLRRASLDLIGRVPTQTEVERFLADPAPHKRARLVDSLLADEAWAQRWAGLWSERLLPGDRKAARYAEQPLEDHLSDALARGRGWDQVVRELLSAEGDPREQPAAAFVGARALRGQRRLDAVAELSSTSARVFLGSRIECAQCHDHPYVPEFSREDFWAQAALFGRAFVAIERDGDTRSITLRERGRGELQVTLDEAGARERPIAPRYMGGGELADPSRRRDQLAASIVDDPRFAEATVGWVWTQLLGRGLVEPWDDLLSDATRPPALTLLAKDFRANDHDLRSLMRTIMLSQAYQRSSTDPGTPKSGASKTVAEIAQAEAVFARARVRPLSAEQLFASLLTVTELEQVGDRKFRRAVRRRKQAALKEYAFVFADDEMASGEALSTTVSQALLLLNGGVTNQGVIARAGSSLDRITAANDDTDARLESLWLTIYGRRPRAEELALGREAVDGRRLAAWEDLMFAMLYSSEFGSNH